VSTRAEEWDRLRQTHLRAGGDRPASTARGVHHVALLCTDVERTIRFYQDVLGFPLVELFENRDYEGSTHFFFDIGHGNLLAFFDFPGLDLGAYAEVLGGLHHLAISVTPDRFDEIRERLRAEGITGDGPGDVDDSFYFRDPDGTRLEIIRNPLREMYGDPIG
jgi:catechol 2,3-dioxygenase-like lactoylglutathione lyase family enzyme